MFIKIILQVAPIKKYFLIFISLFIFSVCFMNSFAGDFKPEGWEKSEIKWVKFAEEHMNRMRKHDLTTPAANYPNYKFEMEWVEIKSLLITKYLPDYKIFTDRRFTFVLDKNEHIICLGKTWPLGRPFQSAPDFETKEYSEFIKERKIKVEDRNDAIDMVKLKEIVDGGHGYVNDNELKARSKNWQYEATKEGKSWIITMKYIGDPSASIMMPPYWEILTNSKNYLEAITEKYNELIPGS